MSDPVPEEVLDRAEVVRPAARHTLAEVEALGGYQIILADPGWEYRNRGRGAAANHYETTPDAALAALPVTQLAARDAVLFLWATWPNLPVALRVMAAWGFKYKTLGFLWVKHYSRNGAMTEQLFTGGGYWTRANTEMVLLGVRGDLRAIRRDVHQLVESWVEGDALGLPPSGERVIRAPHLKVKADGKLKISHSAKPPEVRDRIVRLMGDLPRIEIFARERAPGWDAWGNEIPSGSDVALEDP